MAALFFLISLGSLAIHKKQNPLMMLNSHTGGKLISLLLSVVPVILFLLVLMEMLDVAWYWLVLIMIPCFFLASVPAVLYSSVFGMKQKVRDADSGELILLPNFLLNGLIALGIGVIFWGISIW